MLGIFRNQYSCLHLTGNSSFFYEVCFLRLCHVYVVQGLFYTVQIRKKRYFVQKMTFYPPFIHKKFDACGQVAVYNSSLI